MFGGFLDNLRSKRKSDGGVIVIDAGDMFQGTIAANETQGVAVIRAYNALGYHAVTIGNHEYDYGPAGAANIPQSPEDNPRGALLAAAAHASFPLLAANTQEKSSSKPVQWPGVAPSTIVEAGGVKIGIVGVASLHALDATIASNVSDLKMAPLAETVEHEAKRLREQGAAFVVVAAHAGGGCKKFDNPDDISSCEPSEIFNLARALDPSLVAVVVAAHTHQAVAHRVNGIAIIQSYAYGSSFGRADVRVDPSTSDAVVVRIHPPQSLCSAQGERQNKAPPSEASCEPGHYEDAPVQRSASVQAAIAQDIQSAEAKRNEPLGITLPKTLSHRGNPSSPAGDHIAAWMLATRPKADIAIVNGGGIRADLPKGPLAYGSLYELFPFDNRYASIRVKVDVARKLLREGLLGADNYSVAGVQVQATCKGDELQVDIIRHGRPLRDNESVVVLMSDYLAMTPRVKQAGMPQEDFVYEQDPPIREAIAAYLRTQGATFSPLSSSPISIPSTWPVSCSGKPRRSYQRF